LDCGKIFVCDNVCVSIEVIEVCGVVFFGVVSSEVTDAVGKVVVYMGEAGLDSIGGSRFFGVHFSVKKRLPSSRKVTK